MSDPRNVILIIADISGYTSFMVANQTELAHSHEIIASLLESIVAQAEIPLSVAKLEGDAVFLYAESDGDSVPRLVREKLLRFFPAFSGLRRELGATRACECGACRNIDRLGLKIIVHQGEAIAVSIAGRTELAGLDVIILHRLLKNTVPASEYILLTDSAARNLAPDLPVGGYHTEHYDEIGDVEVVYYLPGS